MNAWLARNVPRFVQLAELPFDRAVHERFFASIGWTIIREDWYPETCFEIHFNDVGRRLVAVYESTETGLGIGLYAVTGPTEHDDYCVASPSELDHAFDRVFRKIAPLLPTPPNTGEYTDQHSGNTYHYAYWEYQRAFLTLVQHFEGDGHCGHEASLDIRLLPRVVEEPLAFPLTTNLLF